MDVIPLPSNRPADRFYRGGRKDHRVSGEPPAGDRGPEDWAASTTTLAGEESLGLTTLLGGRFLKAAIETRSRCCGSIFAATTGRAKHW